MHFFLKEIEKISSIATRFIKSDDDDDKCKKNNSDAVIISLSSRATSFRDHNLNFLYVFIWFFLLLVHLFVVGVARARLTKAIRYKQKTLAYSLKYVSHDLNICSTASAINFLLATHCFLECFFSLFVSYLVCYVAKWKVQVKKKTAS